MRYLLTTLFIRFLWLQSTFLWNSSCWVICYL